MSLQGESDFFHRALRALGVSHPDAARAEAPQPITSSFIALMNEVWSFDQRGTSFCFTCVLN